MNDFNENLINNARNEYFNDFYSYEKEINGFDFQDDYDSYFDLSDFNNLNYEDDYFDSY